jgi:hypothetical protein
MNLTCSQNMLAQSIDQRCEQLAGCADPSGQRGAIEIDAFASVYLRLAIERAVVAIMWCTT